MKPSTKKSKSVGGKSKSGVGRPSNEQKLQNLADLVFWIQNQFDASNKRITSDDIAARFRISAIRVRKLLDDLGQLILRVKSDPAGITLTNNASSFYWEQLARNSELKEQIAEKMIKLLPHDATIKCSAGTTVARVCRRIIEAHRDVRIITNSLAVIDLAFEYPATLELAGGTYHAATHSCVGDLALRGFKEASCACAIVGVSGIDERGRLFVKHREEVELLKEMVESATDAVYVVATCDKLARNDIWPFGSIPDLVRVNGSGRKRKVWLVTNSVDDYPSAPADEKSSVVSSSDNTNKELAKAVYDALREYIPHEENAATKENSK